MAERRYQIVLYRGEDQQLTLEELASSTGLHPALVERFVEFGLLDPVGWAGPQLFFETGAVLRLRTIERLRHEVGINLTGIAVILDLLDRLRASQHQSRLADLAGWANWASWDHYSSPDERGSQSGAEPLRQRR